MGLTVEGPTIEKLVEEVEQAMMKGTTDLQVLKMEFNELQGKISMLAKWLEGESPNLC